MAPTMIDQIVESPGAVPSATLSFEADPLEMPPKLKGRRRLLQSLQRMSSSPSLARMGRTPSSGYRSGGKGSISCVSLSSTSSLYGHSYGNSYSSQFSGLSTAPTSALATPGLDSCYFDPNARIRVIENENFTGGLSTPTSIPLPAELRPSPKNIHLTSPHEGVEISKDYFSRPAAQPKVSPRRENFNFWADMPGEMKVHIFQYLKPKEIVRCSSVSKAWHKMCFDGQLWISLDTSEFYRDIPGDSLVKIITAAGPFVRDLNLRGCVQMREKWMSEGQRLSDACRNLVNFSIEGCRIDRSSIHYFLLRNPRLVHINISGLTATNNSAMKIIAQGCPQLEYLNVSWCSNIDTQGLKRVVQSCPKLKDLRAGEVKGFNDKSFMLELFKRNTLERLVVHHCETLDDDSLQVLVQGINAEIDPLTDRPIVPPRAFKHLDFTRCRNLTDRGLALLAHNVPHLEGLQLSQCQALTDDALSGIIASSPRLTHLDLEELDELSNTTLQNLAKAPSNKRLEHLSISYCENLGDSGMLQVVKECPNLKSLDMDNTRISDLVLIELASQVRSRSRNPSVAGTLAQKPKVGLRMVVYDCQNVTWTGVREVLSRNAEIKRPVASSSFTSTAATYPSDIIQLKCFYGWQMTVEEHTKRVLRGDLAAAARLERKWAEYMMANEEAGAGGAGSRRRRRRAREAAALHADEEEGGGAVAGGMGVGRRRRARSGGCVMM
ncbi:hypothetical protein MMC16_005924 [Acarospora aff. strigata]|nr:hypothetical protein [Acarospora aff. strigata]